MEEHRKIAMVARSHTVLPAMRNTLLPLVVACGLVFLGAEVWAWQTNISGTAGGGVVNAAAVDGAGNVVAAGSINSMGTHYFAITKYDGASGTELWQHHLRLGIAHEIVVDGAGDVIAAGIVGSAGTVVKLRGADGGDFTPPDTEPPTVTITSPENLALISVTVSADASDNVGVAGVQFQLDGAPLGPEDTEGPYAVNWDTATTGIGQHTLTAVARDAAGNRATAAPVTVTVVNLPALPGL